MMQNPKPNRGFTLIEIIVVITLIGLMLFITVPRFQNTLLLDNTKKVSRWITASVQGLKRSAVQHQRQYTLHLNMDADKLWTTHAAMSEDEIQKASQDAFELPADVKLMDVEYPDNEKVSAGQAVINFYQKDYSDMAIIHFQNSDNEQLSFAVEPFLPRVKLYQKYKEYKD